MSEESVQGTGIGADTIAAALDRRATEHPDRLLLRCGDADYTYADMRTAARSVAAGFGGLGVANGDRVAILLPNRPEIFELYFGLAVLGAVQVPLNAFLKGEFLKYQLTDAAAETLVVDEAGWEAVRPLLDDLPTLKTIVAVDSLPAADPTSIGRVRYRDLIAAEPTAAPVPVHPADLMSILYTSGTTGLPTGCMLTNGYYLRTGRVVSRLTGQTADDVLFTALPAFHALTRAMVIASALVQGSTAVIEQRFAASTFLTRAREVGATIVHGVGAVATALLATPRSASDRDHRIRCMMCPPLSVAEQHEFQQRFGIDAWAEVLGQTECMCVTASRVDGRRNRATAGQAGDDVELALRGDDERPLGVGEVGEICVRPRHRYAMFDGYWGKPEETLAVFTGLWYHTGDFGKCDEDGYYSFVDRKKDAIRSRGENISSFEVESAVGQHPSVREAAAVGVPRGSSEDDVKVVLALHDDVQLDPEDFFDFLKREVPYFAVPRYVAFVDELPRNASGRVMKFQLREHGPDIPTWDFRELGLVIERSARR